MQWKDKLGDVTVFAENIKRLQDGTVF